MKQRRHEPHRPDHRHAISQEAAPNSLHSRERKISSSTFPDPRNDVPVLDRVNSMAA